MAKKDSSGIFFQRKPKKKGKAAKTKQSNSKQSKNYVKKYRGQGR
jgi:hypothetical protein